MFSNEIYLIQKKIIQVFEYHLLNFIGQNDSVPHLKY